MSSAVDRGSVQAAERSPGVLHVTIADAAEGGAAKAAYALHSILRADGLRSQMLVRMKSTQDPDVHETAPLRPWTARRRQAARLVRRPPPLPAASATFNFDLLQDFDESSLFRLDPAEIDVICLHRTTRFLTVRQIRLLADHYRRPLVWLLHDQFPVTGGCHFSLGCDAFTRRCGCCPQLSSSDPNDLTRRLWDRKKRDLTGVPITFVAQSTDAERWVRESSLFSDHRVERIPQPIDADVFRPVDPAGARERLGLPPDAKVVMIGAGDLKVARKGTHHALEALRALDEDLRTNVHLLVAGKKGETLAAEAGVPGVYVGLLRDDLALALLYQAADVYLSPSLAESGPLMVPEALLCGRPVVSFRLGAAADLIAPGETGYLAEPADSRGLAEGLAWALKRDRTRADEQRCRRTALGFRAERVAAAFAELFRDLSSGSGPTAQTRRAAGAAPPRNDRR